MLPACTQGSNFCWPQLQSHPARHATAERCLFVLMHTHQQANRHTIGLRKQASAVHSPAWSSTQRRPELPGQGKAEATVEGQSQLGAQATRATVIVVPAGPPRCPPPVLWPAKPGVGSRKRGVSPLRCVPVLRQCLTSTATSVTVDGTPGAAACLLWRRSCVLATLEHVAHTWRWRSLHIVLVAAWSSANAASPSKKAMSCWPSAAVWLVCTMNLQSIVGGGGGKSHGRFLQVRLPA